MQVRSRTAASASPLLTLFKIRPLALLLATNVIGVMALLFTCVPPASAQLLIGGTSYAPTNLSASAGNAQVALAWSPSPNGFPPAPSIAAMAGFNYSSSRAYYIYRGTAAGGEGSTPLFQVPAPSGTGAVSYTDTSAVNGTTYYYQVTAVTVVTGTGTNFSTGQPFSYTAAQSESVRSNEASATPTAPVALAAPTDLAVYATGSGKVTLYWSGVANASGYNVYRGTAAGGEDYVHPVNGATPVTTKDTGPGVTNMFLYSDTGLTNGTEYFYTVKAVNGSSQSAPSNEDSAVPDPNAVPWDTGNAVQIIAKINATAANDLEPDIDEDTGDRYPADVGFLNVAAPDGVIYLGNFPDGSTPKAYASPGHFDAASGMIANSDGTFTTAPGDSATSSTNGMSTTSMGSPTASASTVADGFPYLPTSPPTGIYREVQAQPGYWGTSATIGLPDASSGSGQVNLVGKDTAYIYLGGSVNYPTGAFPAGTRVPDFQLDAGFQLSENPCPNQQWVPYVGGHQPNDPIINGGVVTTSGSGWYTYMSGEIRTQFLTPNFSSVPDKTIKLHFSVPVGGIGTGKIIVAQTQGKDPNQCPHRISSFSAYSVTLVYAHVRGWRTSQYNAVHPEAGNNRFILKRINSIAQTLNPANYNAATDTPHSGHPGAPLANGPSEYNSKGFLMDGSYVQAFGGGSFSGAYWGYSDTFGVELYSPSGGWSSWTNDSSVTLHAGAYPIGLPYVTWVEQNPFYWETNVALRTTH